MDDAQKLDMVRKGKGPVTNAAGSGSLGLLCNELQPGESLEMIVTRGANGVWGVVITLPNGTVWDGDANTVPNAIWAAMTS